MLPLPDPPLTDGIVRLRPWSVHDVDALVEAWADEEIQKWTLVPARRDANQLEPGVRDGSLSHD